MILTPETKTRKHENDWEENTRAFFILGTEGSGTNMLFDALVEAGCFWSLIKQGINTNFKFEEETSPFVFRRSIPHAGEHRDIWNIADKLDAAFDGVHVLGIFRDPYATVQSVLRRDPDRDEKKLFFNQMHSVRNIGGVATRKGRERTFITYEAFVGSEGFRRWLFEERLGLPYPEDFEVRDENDKYYNS